MDEDEHRVVAWEPARRKAQKAMVVSLLSVFGVFCIVVWWWRWGGW